MEGIQEAAEWGKKQGRKECIQCCKNCNRSVFTRSHIRESRGKWKQRRRRREGAGEWKSWRGGGGKGKVGMLIWECYHGVQRPALVSACKVSYSHYHHSHKAYWSWLGFTEGSRTSMALPASLSWTCASFSLKLFWSLISSKMLWCTTRVSLVVFQVMQESVKLVVLVSWFFLLTVLKPLINESDVSCRILVNALAEAGSFKNWWYL